MAKQKKTNLRKRKSEQATSPTIHKKQSKTYTEEELNQQVNELDKTIKILKNIVLGFSCFIIALNIYHVFKLEFLGQNFGTLLDEYPSFIEKLKIAEINRSQRAISLVGKHRYLKNGKFGTTPLHVHDDKFNDPKLNEFKELQKKAFFLKRNQTGEILRKYYVPLKKRSFSGKK